jgi:hypothetical protein
MHARVLLRTDVRRHRCHHHGAAPSEFLFFSCLFHIKSIQKKGAQNIPWAVQTVVNSRPFWIYRNFQYRIAAAVRKRPFLLFGVPFIALMVGSSFALTSMTQTRYEIHRDKVQRARSTMFHLIRMIKLDLFFVRYQKKRCWDWTRIGRSTIRGKNTS